MKRMKIYYYALCALVITLVSACGEEEIPKVEYRTIPDSQIRVLDFFRDNMSKLYMIENRIYAMGEYYGDEGEQVYLNRGIYMYDTETGAWSAKPVWYLSDDNSREVLEDEYYNSLQSGSEKKAYLEAVAGIIFSSRAHCAYKEKGYANGFYRTNGDGTVFSLLFEFDPLTKKMSTIRTESNKDESETTYRMFSTAKGLFRLSSSDNSLAEYSFTDHVWVAKGILNISNNDYALSMQFSEWLSSCFMQSENIYWWGNDAATGAAQLLVSVYPYTGTPIVEQVEFPRDYGQKSNNGDPIFANISSFSFVMNGKIYCNVGSYFSYEYDPDTHKMGVVFVGQLGSLYGIFGNKIYLNSVENQLVEIEF